MSWLVVPVESRKLILCEVSKMACRERGKIQTAQRYEKICERIYEELPVFALRRLDLQRSHGIV